ncbi:hypothetical protein SEUCBS139899_008780 [Sporothrix eucalyptigena]
MAEQLVHYPFVQDTVLCIAVDMTQTQIRSIRFMAVEDPAQRASGAYYMMAEA